MRSSAIERVVGLTSGLLSLANFAYAIVEPAVDVPLDISIVSFGPKFMIFFILEVSLNIFCAFSLVWAFFAFGSFNLRVFLAPTSAAMMAYTTCFNLEYFFVSQARLDGGNLSIALIVLFVFAFVMLAAHMHSIYGDQRSEIMRFPGRFSGEADISVAELMERHFSRSVVRGLMAYLAMILGYAVMVSVFFPEQADKILDVFGVDLRFSTSA